MIHRFLSRQSVQLNNSHPGILPELGLLGPRWKYNIIVPRSKFPPVFSSGLILLKLFLGQIHNVFLGSCGLIFILPLRLMHLFFAVISAMLVFVAGGEERKISTRHKSWGGAECVLWPVSKSMKHQKKYVRVTEMWGFFYNAIKIYSISGCLSLIW